MFVRLDDSGTRQPRALLAIFLERSRQVAASRRGTRETARRACPAAAEPLMRRPTMRYVPGSKTMVPQRTTWRRAAGIRKNRETRRRLHRADHANRAGPAARQSPAWPASKVLPPP